MEISAISPVADAHNFSKGIVGVIFGSLLSLRAPSTGITSLVVVALLAFL